MENFDREKDEDLFWAIRGGGGASFGVILAWRLKLVRVPENVTVFTIRRKLDGNPILSENGKTSHQPPKICLSEQWFQMGNHQQEMIPKGVWSFYFQAQYIGPVDELIPLLKQYFPSKLNLDRKRLLQESFPPDAEKECYEVPWIRSVLFFFWRKPNDSLEVLLEKTIPTLKNYHKGTSDFVKTPIPETNDRDCFLKKKDPRWFLSHLEEN
ncbi:hypothetical protein HAX54_007916 [Datura stramonium]|uniref:Uncharacterized protein n=1 Tax=Datura stramonium TaxID=4076 RepID=A0ABS8WUY1_DATST|nr:hypothetical protein [Datura stramonium]